MPSDTYTNRSEFLNDVYELTKDIKFIEMVEELGRHCDNKCRSVMYTRDKKVWERYICKFMANSTLIIDGAVSVALDKTDHTLAEWVEDIGYIIERRSPEWLVKSLKEDTPTDFVENRASYN